MARIKLGAILLFLLSIATAAIADPCGDANNDGFMSWGDVVYMLDYTFAGGPPPPNFDNADFDLAQGWTIRDAAWQISCMVFECIPSQYCPPVHPPISPQTASGYRIRHTTAFPAHREHSVLDLALDAAAPIEGLQLAIRISLEGGAVPTVDSVHFPLAGNDFLYFLNKIAIVDSGDVVVLGSASLGFSAVEAPVHFARIFLSAQVDTASRLITLEYADYVPALAPPGHNDPIPAFALTYNGCFRPTFYGTCCIVPGDANGDGLASISDVVYLISYYFAGGPAPSGCTLLGDADGNGLLSISDAVYMISYIFEGGPAPLCS